MSRKLKDIEHVRYNFSAAVLNAVLAVEEIRQGKTSDFNQVQVVALGLAERIYTWKVEMAASPALILGLRNENRKFVEAISAVLDQPMHCWWFMGEEFRRSSVPVETLYEGLGAFARRLLDLNPEKTTPEEFEEVKKMLLVFHTAYLVEEGRQRQHERERRST